MKLNLLCAHQQQYTLRSLKLVPALHPTDINKDMIISEQKNNEE